MKSLIAVLFSLVGGLCTIIFARAHTFTPRADRHELLAPPRNMRAFSFGYNEIVADSLWLRLIQDFDQCGRATEKTAVSPVPNGAEAVAREIGQRTGRCENSWVYEMLDAITELAPDFETAYSQGGVILSVAVDDVGGAARIYDKGIAKFPHDWHIAFKSAYHSLYEMGNRKKAADLLMITSEIPGSPKWLPILAARLYSKTGAATLGKKVLEDYIAANPERASDPHLKQRMAEIDRDLAAGDDPEPAPAKPAQQPATLPKKKQ